MLLDNNNTKRQIFAWRFFWKAHLFGIMSTVGLLEHVCLWAQYRASLHDSTAEHWKCIWVLQVQRVHLQHRRQLENQQRWAHVLILTAIRSSGMHWFQYLSNKKKKLKKHVYRENDEKWTQRQRGWWEWEIKIEETSVSGINEKESEGTADVECGWDCIMLGCNCLL